MRDSYLTKGDIISNRFEVHDVFLGGMAVVYVVYDRQLQDVFVLKSFRDEVFARDPRIVERFEDEARTWINIENHPNITKAWELIYANVRPILIMEYVNGGDLAQWIGKPRLLGDYGQVLSFAIQICRGMEHAFQNGVKAHLDLKPQNCLVTVDRVLKITDFGLARASILEDRKGRPEVGGTLPYMAPEQFDAGSSFDMRTDIYAFGIMLFEMLSGDLPFEARTWRGYEELHKKQPPPPLTAHGSNIGAIIRTCLAKSPHERFVDFGQLGKALDDVYRNLTGESYRGVDTITVDDSAILNNRGASLARLNRHEEAIELFDRALAANPRNELAWTNRGASLHALGRFADALSSFDEALRLKPDHAEAWVNKSFTLAALGRFDEEKVCLERALELDPYLVQAWLNKGALLHAEKKYEEAIGCFERAIELEPNHGEAWFSKGSSLARLQEIDQALECFDRCLALNPRHERAWYNKGLALGEKGLAAEELACYEKAVEVDPDYDQAWYNMGVVYGQLGQPEKEISCYDEAIRANAGHLSAWLNKGIECGNQGRIEEALECFERVLELDPGHFWARKNLETARQMLRK